LPEIVGAISAGFSGSETTIRVGTEAGERGVSRASCAKTADVAAQTNDVKTERKALENEGNVIEDRFRKRTGKTRRFRRFF